jgi:hypothetical protein
MPKLPGAAARSTRQRIAAVKFYVGEITRVRYVTNLRASA